MKERRKRDERDTKKRREESNDSFIFSIFGHFSETNFFLKFQVGLVSSSSSHWLVGPTIGFYKTLQDAFNGKKCNRWAIESEQDH